MGLTRCVSTMRLKPTLSLANDATSGISVSPTALAPADKPYDSTTTPPATKYAGQTEAITGGSNTIDLTALVDIEGNAVDGSGLTVQEVVIQAASANVAPIVVSGGVADPYELFGSGNSVSIEAGGTLMMRFNDMLDEIATSTASTATDIKFTGTTGDIYTYEFLLG